MAFDEIRFPSAIALRAAGGPERRTDVVTTASGREERNARWAGSRRRYETGYGVKTLDDIHAVVAFFEERRGRLHGFRFKDHADFKSCAPQATVSAEDQAIGTGDGETATFQLVKRYGSGLRDHLRAIAKPVAGTVRVAVDGTEKTAGTHFTVDHAMGIATFLEGHIPAEDAAVTAGFEFDVPVRFDSDRLAVNLAGFAAGDIPDIVLVEIVP
ncbi:MAG: TIGR02217 family protein [Parvibaculaceae bacterium]